MQSAQIVVIEHEPGCTLDRMGGWLEDAVAATDVPVVLDVLRPYVGNEIPSRVLGDALVVLGGSRGANDDTVWPWLPATRALLASAVDDEVPTLGICLGAQLLAVACGGRVEVGAAGIEACVVDARWRHEAAGDPLVGGLPDPFPGPSMHRDAITVLPPGAVWLAETAMYPHQAFRQGRAAWGVQFHPEVSEATFRGWADEHEAAGDWARWGIDGDAVVAELRDRDDEVVAAGRALSERFVSVVRDPADSRKPVHHTS
jgi:GMP synthase (glutamine-hydrolysing)